MPSTSLTKPNQLVTRMTTTHIMLIVLLVLNSTTTSTSSLSTPTFTGPRIVSLRPSHVSVGVKGTAIFECQVVAYPLAKISWRKNGRRVSEAASKSSKFKQTHGSNVSILRVNDVNHAMNITCVAEADSSTTSTPTVSEATAHLRTLSNDRFLPKIRITNPKSVEPDTIFKIDCNVTSPGSGATVHWYQANRPISFENPKYFSNVSWIDADSHRHTLYVRGLSLSSDPLIDSLEIDFSCLAVNTYGTSIADTSILVRNRLMPPIFIAPKRSLIELEYGSSANISCIANGMPRPRVKWLEAKPETPSDLKVATVYSNSIEIEWRQSGVTDVNYYVVKYRKYPLDNELALEVDEFDEEVNLDSTESDDFNLSEYYYKRVNSTLTKVKIGSNLTAYTLYEFRVAAVNALGTSDETEPILVRTAATKPGLVKNMRYVQKNDDTYLIKCDEPDEPNGNINSFMIYYTDQVTNPLKSWMSVNVPATEMPYELKLKPKSARRTRQSPLSNSIAERSFFIRISAVNLEMGEGPYSNIIQLKRINHRFEAPTDLIVKQVNSTEALLKWSYKTSSLESIYRQLSGDQSDVDIEPEDLIKNLYFELYIIKKASNLSETSRTMPKFPSMSAFRTIEAIDSALVDSITSTNSKPTASSSIVFRAKSSQRQRNIKKRSSPTGSHSIQFEFTLDNLVPSTLYSIEMAPRLFLMEGLNSRTIRFTTQRTLISIFYELSHFI